MKDKEARIENPNENQNSKHIYREGSQNSEHQLKRKMLHTNSVFSTGIFHRKLKIYCQSNLRRTRERWYYRYRIYNKLGTADDTQQMERLEQVSQGGRGRVTSRFNFFKCRNVFIFLDEKQR